MSGIAPGQLPWALGGAVVGACAFLPLVAVVLPVLARKAAADMARGVLALAVSFVILVAAFFLVYFLAPANVLVFALGMVFGFILVWIILAVGVIMQR